MIKNKGAKVRQIPVPTKNKAINFRFSQTKIRFFDSLIRSDDSLFYFSGIKS